MNKHLVIFLKKQFQQIASLTEREITYTSIINATSSQTSTKCSLSLYTMLTTSQYKYSNVISFERAIYSQFPTI